MSSRNLTVKTIKHNNNNHHSSSFVASSKSSPTVSKYQKDHSHTSIQQPKKNNNQKLQATNKNSKNNHGRNKQNHKKVVIPVEDDNSSTSSSSSSSEEESSPRQNQKTMRKNYAKQQQQQFEYKSFVDQVYAGPTFNNAPLPSALPIPAFNARGSPINYHPQPLYYPHSVNNPSLQQQSMDLMNLITPQKVVTAYELEKTNLALSEIQRGLRSMLKIES